MTEPSLNGYHFYHGFILGFLSIRGRREQLNRINVFPVADGDTGSNLVGTIKTVADRLEASRSASRVLNHIASISLESARGNSGLIFSQYLNGLAINTAGKKRLTVHEFAEAAKTSVAMAYAALENPVEGTILTILSVWSDSLYEGCRRRKTLESIFRTALSLTREALENTKNQIDVLKKNDVLDAGAMGIVSFLEGMERILSSGPVPLSLRKSLKQGESGTGLPPVQGHHELNSEIPFRYCTEVLLNHNGTDQQELKHILADKGDSLIVSRGHEKSRIHIHTNAPHEIVRLLDRVGEISGQKVDDMVRQEQAVNRRLAATAVLTDSVADIPLEIRDRYQIHVINLKLFWENREYRDRITITPDQFYSWQKTRTSFPVSSLPDEKTVFSMYRFLLEHYENVIVLPVGKSLSGTWNQMAKIAGKFNSSGTRIAVVDTCLNSAAQGLLVREIARQASEGKSLNELVEAAEELKTRIKIYVSVSTFKYMVKGGRMSPLKGFIAQALGIKPIVSLDRKGKGKALDKAFTSKGLMKKISRIIEETERMKGIESYVLVHADAREKAEERAASFEKLLGREADYIEEISPIVGMHAGRGALAVAVLEKK